MVRFEIFKTEDGQFNCRIVSVAFSEITFSGEGRKNKKDVRAMTESMIHAIQVGAYEIIEVKDAPRKPGRPKG